MLSTEELRKFQCQECGDKDPNCNSIVLSPRCHLGGGVTVDCSGDHIHITCFTCKAMVAVLQAPSPLRTEGVRFDACHDKGVFAIYRKTAHALDLQCADCKRIVGTITIPALN